MKTIKGLLLIVILLSCSEDKKEFVLGPSSDEYRNITEELSANEFENIKVFILQNGDKQTFCNMFNHNPNYSFSGFEVYLNPEVGQLNINCDPAISDFNEIVIQDLDSDPPYYHIRIVKQGHIKNEKIFVPEGMQERNVYLLKYYNYNLDSMEASVRTYINLLRIEMNRR